MANGTIDYLLGELKSSVDALTIAMEHTNQKVDTINTYVENQKGSLGTLKWIVGAIGLGTVVNIVLWIAGFYVM